MSCYWPVWGVVRSKWCCDHKEGRYIATHQGKNFGWALVGPKQDFLLHSTTTPRQLKHCKLKKIIKLGFLSLPYWFLTESSQYQSWKANLFPALAGNNLGPLELNLICNPSGHWSTITNSILKDYIPKIKFLQSNPNDILLPWSKAAHFCP